MTERKNQLTNQLDRLRKQHLWGLIDDESAQTEGHRIQEELRSIPARASGIDAYRAPAELLRSVGAIIAAATRTERPDAMEAYRSWIRTVFARIETDGTVIREVQFREQYRELFAVGTLKSVSMRCAPDWTQARTSPLFGVSTSVGAISVPQLPPLWMALA
jgi:hypothetical protein